MTKEENLIMKTHKVYIPKIGDYIDGGIGGFYVDEFYQNEKIEEAKQRWREAIKCEQRLVSETVKKEGKPPYLKFKTAPNPYFGWKESQLEIIIR